jgi:beta-lactamase regulating signal transducer with metallopeptidase domain
MSTTDLLGGPLAQAIGLALLHTLWQGAIVAGVLAAMLALLSRRSASLRYAIACAALLLVFALAVATAYRLYTPRTEQPLTEAATIGAASAPSSAAPAADHDVLIVASDAPSSWQDRWLAALSAVRAHIPQIVVIWLAGVLLLTLRLAASWTRARALAGRGSVTADESWQRVAARLSDALGLRHAVRLVICVGVDVPSVIGWLKPTVLLPVSSFTGLTPDQLEMVLAHELAHIRRHDFVVNAMQSVIETLLFYHPAVWYLSRQIRVERENCCDDLAVSVCGDALSYARALAQLEELRGVPSLAVAANGGSLIERVRRLVGAHNDRSLFSNGWTAAAAMASFVALIALTTAPMLAARRGETPKPPGTEVIVAAPEQAPKPGEAARKEKTPKADTTPQAEEDPSDETDVSPEPPEPPDPPEPMFAPGTMIVPMPGVTPRPMIAPRVPVTPRVPITTTTRIVMAGMAPQAVIEGVEGAFDDESDNNDEPSSPTPPGKLSIDELISLRVQGVTPEYIQAMRSAGFGELPLRDIISMRVQGVTTDYVQKMRATGLGDLSARDIIGLKVQGVSPEYITAMRSSGVQLKSARDAISLRVQGVSPEFVRQLAAAGYDKMTVRDLVRLAAAGVNADYIKEMSKYKK